MKFKTHRVELEPLETRLMLDGSAVLVKDINDFASSNALLSYGKIGDDYLIAAHDDASGVELWKTDGTEAGTALVKDINHGGASSNPRLFFSNLEASIVYFRATDQFGGDRLWVTDGTAAGTDTVSAVNQPSLLDLERQGAKGFVNPGLLGWSESGLQFRATSNSEPLLINGQIRRPMPATKEGSPTLVSTDSFMFFIVEGSVWRSDGTSDGTQAVESAAQYAVNKVHEYDLDYRLYPLKDSVLFWHCVEADCSLFRTDGDVTHIVTWPQDFEDVHVIDVVGDRLYFSAAATDGVGFEIWSTAGTTGETFKVMDAAIDYSAVDINVAKTNGALFLRLHNEQLDRYELWGTVGTGFHQLAVGPAGPGSHPRDMEIVPADDQLFFRLRVVTPAGDERNSIRALWRSDGTVKGTYSLLQGMGYRGFVHNWQELIHGKLVFVRGAFYPDYAGDELWSTDGTIEGTVPLLDVATPGEPVRLDMVDTTSASAFFYRDDELWMTDGTVEGTTFVQGDFPPSHRSYAFWSPEKSTSVGETVFFGTRQRDAARLWRSDGTEAGTLPISLGTANQTAPKYMREYKGDVYFVSDGNKLWRMLGTLPSSELIPGDTNADGNVDFTDFLALSANFGRNDVDGFADGDFNDDDVVDFADFLLLSENFGRTRASTDPALAKGSA